MVLEEDIPIYSSAQFIGIKYTTAKDIVRKYKKEKKGRLGGALSGRSGQRKESPTDHSVLVQENTENKREEVVRA